jgi:hypothetical protein
MRMSRSCTFFGCEFPASALLAASLLSPPLARAQAETVSMTAQKLQAFPVTANEQAIVEIPKVARPLLTQFKREIRDLIAAKVNLDRDGSVAALRNSILEDLKRSGAIPDASNDLPETDDNRYGFVSELKIESPPQHQDLLAAILKLQIPCGSDSSLYVFQKENNRWNLVLAEEANDYAEIYGAQGSMGYAISPPDESGQWFVATTNVNPSCASNWQGVRFKALRPGLTADEPRFLLNEHSGIFLGEDEVTNLQVARDSFSLSFVAEQGLDLGIMLRVHHFKYSVSADRATRIPPLAFLPQDFLDEWLNLPWDEAARWTDDSALVESRDWHARAEEITSHGPEFDFVQLCGMTNPAVKWLLGLVFADSNPGVATDLPEELYFTVRSDGRAFYLAGASPSRPQGCPGTARPVDTLDWKRLPE